MASAYDLFVSYRRKDMTAVMTLVERLRKEHKLGIWVDLNDIERFEASTRAIAEGLAKAKALLVWYSKDYPESRPCQWELTNAFIAAQGFSKPMTRILVVNPERDNEHIHPIELRDQNFLHVGGGKLDPDTLAGSIAAHLRAIDPVPLGDVHPLTPPQWFGRFPASSSRFVGRLAHLWRVHSALQGVEHAIVAKRPIPVVQLRGLGGLGKTMLAEEYALRFAASFPGGVFWLQAPGSDALRHTAPADQREAIRNDQMRIIAMELGATAQELSGPHATRSVLSAALARHLDGLAHKARGPAGFLWVIDDLPTGISRTDIDRWLPPHPLGKTLITTQSREHDTYGTVVDLGPLAEEEAVALLEMQFAASSEAERRSASAIAKDLGFLPLALEVAGATLKQAAGLLSYEEYREQLSHPGKDALEFGARLVDELPTGHTASVARTILASLQKLGAEGRDLIWLATQLAPSPIPSRLVQSVFAIEGGLDQQASLERAILSFNACTSVSLADQVRVSNEVAQYVHPVIARTLRLHEKDSPRPLALRRAAFRALLADLPAVADARNHRALQSLVTHARHLVVDTIDDEAAVDVLGWVARFDQERGHYEAAAQLSERRVAESERLFGTGPEKTLLALGDLARALHGMGRYREASEVEKRVVRGRSKLLGPEHVDTLTAMNNHAGTLAALGDYRAALALQKKVLDARMRVLGEDHPHTLFAINNYGASLGEYGDINKARAFLEKAYSSRKRILGDDHPDTLATGTTLGTILFRMGEGQHGRKVLAATADSRRRVLGDEHPSTLLTECSLGRVMIAAGDAQSAKTLLESTLGKCLRRLGDAHTTTFLAMNNLGRALCETGDLERARQLYASALAGQRAVTGERHPLSMRYALNLFEVMMKQEKTQQARELFDELLRWVVVEKGPQRIREHLEIRQSLVSKYPDLIPHKVGRRRTTRRRTAR